MHGFHTSDAVHEAFYAAFAAADKTAMREIWAESGEILCIHPGGRAMVTLDEILTSWDQILGNLARSPVTIVGSTLQRFDLGDSVLYTVSEHLPGADGEPGARVLATNLVRVGPSGWRMAVHHASPALIDGERGSAGSRGEQSLH